MTTDKSEGCQFGKANRAILYSFITLSSLAIMCFSIIAVAHANAQAETLRAIVERAKDQEDKVGEAAVQNARMAEQVRYISETVRRIEGKLDGQPKAGAASEMTNPPG